MRNEVVEKERLVNRNCKYVIVRALPLQFMAYSEPSFSKRRLLLDDILHFANNFIFRKRYVYIFLSTKEIDLIISASWGPQQDRVNGFKSRIFQWKPFAVNSAQPVDYRVIADVDTNILLSAEEIRLFRYI